jgi:hypothetical protein
MQEKSKDFLSIMCGEIRPKCKLIKSVLGANPTTAACTTTPALYVLCHSVF